MEYLAYSYIAHPAPAQGGAFVRSRGATGTALSHLGKRDPPGRFVGSLDDAVPVICSGTDATNWTFAVGSSSASGSDRVQGCPTPRCPRHVPTGVLWPQYVVARRRNSSCFWRYSDAGTLASTNLGRWCTYRRNARRNC